MADINSAFAAIEKKGFLDIDIDPSIDLFAEIEKLKKEKAKTDEDVEKIGTEWLVQQSKELRKFGVPVLHYYTLGRPNVIADVVKELV